MKNQALFCLKDKSKKNKMSSAAILVWRLRVNVKKERYTVQLSFWSPFSKGFNSYRKDIAPRAGNSFL